MNKYIELINNSLSVVTLLQDLFNIEANEEGVTKTYCPEGEEHSDKGRSPTLKVFPDSNSAWCFSHSKMYNPAQLAKVAVGSSRVESCKKILELYKISTAPPTVEERNQILDEMEKSEEIDVDEAREALFTYARTLKGWNYGQYRPTVVKAINSVLRELKDTDSSFESMDDWLTSSKRWLDNIWVYEELT